MMRNSPTRGHLRCAAALIALAASALSVAALAQGAGLSVWQGAYSAEQATRGKAAYDADCASCHGDTLVGGDGAPALAGPAFLNSWNSTSAGDLFERIQTTMPASDPGSLTGGQVADIEAYIFQANGFPAGATPLASGSAALGGIKIVASKPAG